MFVFIAGAISTLAFVAATVVVSISSQIPFAIFPITFAVAGATKNKPVCLASEEVAEGKITYRLLTPEEIEQKEYEHHLEQEKQQKELEQD